ncbi:hypothetical protein [Neobacillus niacini]|uniref:hypothetical protein n=1 Tax=Neobacillus niacini TaxID=86668 RepID=UPI00288A00A2|nr:hypothetical protein [Neobacillus niacini]
MRREKGNLKIACLQMDIAFGEPDKNYGSVANVNDSGVSLFVSTVNWLVKPRKFYQQKSIWIWSKIFAVKSRFLPTANRSIITKKHGRRGNAPDCHALLL